MESEDIRDVEFYIVLAAFC